MHENPAIIPELKVANFQLSLKFYVDLAGFKVLYERPEDDFAMLDLNGARLMIEGLTGKSRTWIVGELILPFGRGMNLQIRVRDAGELYNKFKAANWPIYQEMEEKWYRVNEQQTGNKQFLVQDPNGYLLRFYEDMGIKG